MASRTALVLVNGVIGKLREERVSALPSSGDPTETLLEFVNDAMSDVLESRTWTFDVYDDGKFIFPAATTGDSATTTANSTSMTVPDSESPTNGDTEGPINHFVGPYRTKLRITDDTNFTNTYFNVRKVEDAGGGSMTFTLSNEFPGDTDAGSAAWETVCYEHVLPSTARKLIWASHQENPVALVGEQRNFEFDAMYPLPPRYQTSRPCLYVTGRSIQNTWTDDATYASLITGAADTTGIGVAIWPVPSSKVIIDYAYVKQHSRLTDDSDTISGVPERILDLIEWKATVKGLYSLMQNDPAHARVLDARVEADIAKFHASHNPGPLVRRVPRPFGSAGAPSRLRGRYLEWEVPAP